ncbi:hypothetical protein PISMIDRAFT_690826 [Pisolithus microcarpus 441]|uniref:Uncharacterized protein n=1 Tax=Pisolithus microcarpus 441 TaxID=765257 RepID=A0A0C9Y0F8_9AGAM|nr:hypothetical protein PISMIDRAFT_690826 [Pisolithus microcarpus 441]
MANAGSPRIRPPHTVQCSFTHVLYYAFVIFSRHIPNYCACHGLRRSLSPVFVRIAGRWCPPWSTH